MSDFLLEMRCEEIPARMQAGARTELEKLFRKEMDAAGVCLGDVTVWSTPRRLALIARGLPDATQAVREEVKGPKVGAPPQALEGFLRKTGLTQDQLEDRGGTYFAVTEKPGRATREVLAEAIPAIVRAFAWPKSMRWGAASLSSESPRWVRPLSGIVAILGEDLVECEVGGIVSSYATLGHRFQHARASQEKVGTGSSARDAATSGTPITIGGAHDYQEKLRACHVIVDHAERQNLIRQRAAETASQAGLTLVADEGLVIENAGLTEWPVPLLGRFDAAFLEVPPEVIQLTARTNQKYFVCNDAEGRLANAFVCTANIEATDGGAAIVDGNRKVLAARLSDARFFWEQDRRKALAEHAKRLENIVFHEKLGTVADKVERVAKLARWLVEENIVVPAKAGTAGLVDASPSPEASGPGSAAGTTNGRLADLAEQAARLCKADLVTEMVGEFPELQGLMGGYYARAEGLPDAVADAIRNHYKPVGQGDEVPTAPVTVAVSLADKLDTVASFFVIREKPTGSKDPYALRRAELGIMRTIQESGLRVAWARLHFEATENVYESALRAKLTSYGSGYDGLEVHRYPDRPEQDDEYGPTHEMVSDVSYEGERVDRAIREARPELATFLLDRLKVQQREAGVRHDLIDAVFALGGEDDLVRLLARVRALQAFVGTEDGANLLAGYKRAANILKKEGVVPANAGTAGLVDATASKADSGPGSGAGTTGFATDKHNLLSYTPEPAERDLIEALDAAEVRARDAVAAEDFAAAMGALASLRSPIDAFFDHVTVNDEDPAKRAARLALLERFRSAVHQVADFSKIEG